MTWLTTVCTEREAIGPWTDCTWASGVMLANERAGYRKYPQTQAEYEGLRADGGDPVKPGDPGSNLTDLSRGLLKRYGWSGNILTTWAAIGSVPVGTAQVVQGLYSALPIRLRRWSKFTGAHAVCVVRIGTGWWWLDPLAPKDYVGEPISADELRAYFEGLAGAKAMAVPVGKEAEMTITLIKGEDWTPTKSATGASNGVLRASPTTSAPITVRISLGRIIRSIAEVKGPDAVDFDFRLTEYDGKPAYMLRRDWAPFVQGGDPAVDQALTDYIAQKPAPLPDCSAEVLAARHVEYARVTGGTTIAFPEPPA